MNAQTETKDNPPQSVVEEEENPLEEDSSDDETLPSNEQTTSVTKRKTFPNKTSYLHNDDRQNCSIGNKVMIGVLLYMKSYGGWDSAMGHSKKTQFLNDAYKHIFDAQGPCRE